MLSSVLLLDLIYGHCRFSSVFQNTTHSRLHHDTFAHTRFIILERVTSLCMTRTHLKLNRGHHFFFKDSLPPVIRRVALTIFLLRICLTGCHVTRTCSLSSQIRGITSPKPPSCPLLRNTSQCVFAGGWTLLSNVTWPLCISYLLPNLSSSKKAYQSVISMQNILYP